MSCPDSIARLLDKRQNLVDNRRNRQAQDMFVARIPELVHDKFREVPRPLSEIGGKLPVIACLDRTLWAQLLGFDLDQYYLDAKAFLEHQLRMDIFHMETIPDDQFFDSYIQRWGGAGFEASLFGMQQHYSATEEPWLEHKPPIQSPEDLERMPQADLTREPMATYLSQHEELLELLDGTGLTPIPPGWIRGPLGVAEELRGISNFVMEMLTEPDFAHAILRYVVDFRRAWCSQRAQYLGIETPHGLMYNDEVQVPMISPRMYKKTILPYEQELHEFSRGLHYWHSCGDATPFMSLVDEIPEITMIQCGAFSDPEAVIETFRHRTAIEIALRPKEDFVEATEDAIRSRIKYLIEMCHKHDVKAACLRLTVYAAGDLSASETLDRVVRWVQIAQEVTEAAAS